MVTNCQAELGDHTFGETNPIDISLTPSCSIGNTMFDPTGERRTAGSSGLTRTGKDGPCTSRSSNPKIICYNRRTETH